MISAIVSLDTTIAQALFAMRSPEFVALFLWITLLGNAIVITVIALSMGVILVKHKESEYIVGLSLSLFGVLASSYLLKILVERARPHPHFRAIDVAGYSLPSMHAAVALAVYGFLIYVVYTRLHPPRHRLFLALMLALFIILIGFSRMYLGVHYLSDVIIGFCIGALWLAFGVLYVVYNRKP